ncbi:Oxidoreductase [Mycena venus]|uniref:Oxidoreductase n=1 Tax=Mycena venus TaxID=2733690 RepID=A0A8H6XDA8_9AGAR|nr:Oxidoreductase [Mycena venus]
MFFATKDWNPDGLHCYVTGGSTGLGLELAKLLVQKGAHVSIVARNQERLDKALAQLETLRTSPGQQLHAYSFSLYTAADSAAALTAACAPHGGDSPDAVFACAGSARPMYFVEMTEEDMRRGMDDAYWVQAWTIFAAVKQMVKQNRKGRLALVSSVVGYMSFLGWGSYSPGETRSPSPSSCSTRESPCTYISPGSMLTPGFEEEQKDKPQISKEIDNAENAITPDVAARAFLRGGAVSSLIFIFDILTRNTLAPFFQAYKRAKRTSPPISSATSSARPRGVTPKHNWVKDAVWDMIAYVGSFPSSFSVISSSASKAKSEFVFESATSPMA